ncbi:MAG: hypothetical protein M3082_06465, partial [Candidatus Dormibacteraeota bacterium]|nr:hypothetical protein [Candidatus Dormibacteraeota bacterium]
GKLGDIVPLSEEEKHVMATTLPALHQCNLPVSVPEGTPERTSWTCGATYLVRQKVQGGGFADVPKTCTAVYRLLYQDGVRNEIDPKTGIPVSMALLPMRQTCWVRAAL